MLIIFTLKRNRPEIDKNMPCAKKYSEAALIGNKIPLMP